MTDDWKILDGRLTFFWKYTFLKAVFMVTGNSGQMFNSLTPHR